MFVAISIVAVGVFEHVWLSMFGSFHIVSRNIRSRRGVELY